MNKDADLKNIIEDVVNFLTDLSVAIPNRVDKELIAFLEGVHANDWMAEMLQQSIVNSKAAEQRKR